MRSAVRFGFCSLLAIVLLFICPALAKAESTMLAVHAVRVQQFADHQAPGDAMITLIEFETDICDPLTDADFSIVVSQVTQATIVSRLPLSTCESPDRKKFHASTELLPPGEPVTVLNPLLVDGLPPAELH